MVNLFKKKLEQHLKDASSWETSAVLAAQQRERIWMKLSAVGVAFGLLGMGGWYNETTKPPSPPFLLRACDVTGAVERIESFGTHEITPNEAADKFFLQQYVMYRETWAPDTKSPWFVREGARRTFNQEYYYRTALMSAPEEQKRFEEFMRESAQSPLKRYGEKVRATIEFRGTTFISPGVGVVRFAVIEEPIGMAAPKKTYHTATITYTQSNGSMKESDRMINPFGHQATHYRMDPDVPDTGAPSAPVMAAAPAAPKAPAPIPVAAPAAPLDLRPLQAKGE